MEMVSLGVVSHWGAFMVVVSLGLIFHEGGLIRVVFHRGGLSWWWFPTGVVFHGGGLSWGGLSWEWSLLD